MRRRVFGQDCGASFRLHHRRRLELESISAIFGGNSSGASEHIGGTNYGGRTDDTLICHICAASSGPHQRRFLRATSARPTLW